MWKTIQPLVQLIPPQKHLQIRETTRADGYDDENDADEYDADEYEYDETTNPRETKKRET